MQDYTGKETLLKINVPLVITVMVKKEWVGVDKKALDTAYDVSSLALKGVSLNSTLGATHYHASYVYPRWANHMERLEQIDTHIFYID